MLVCGYMKISAQKDDVNIRIRRATMKRLKTKAARYGTNVKELLDAYSKGNWFRA